MIISKPSFTLKLAPIAELPHLEHAASAQDTNSRPDSDLITQSNSASVQSSRSTPGTDALSYAATPLRADSLKMHTPFPSIDPFAASFDEREYARAYVADRSTAEPKAAAALHGFTELATGDGLGIYQALYNKLEVQIAPK